MQKNTRKYFKKTFKNNGLITIIILIKDTIKILFIAYKCLTGNDLLCLGMLCRRRILLKNI